VCVATGVHQLLCSQNPDDPACERVARELSTTLRYRMVKYTCYAGRILRFTVLRCASRSGQYYFLVLQINSRIPSQWRHAESPTSRLPFRRQNFQSTSSLA